MKLTLEIGDESFSVANIKETPNLLVMVKYMEGLLIQAGYQVGNGLVIEEDYNGEENEDCEEGRGGYAL